MSTLISIIVPVYNVKAYLNQCVNSLLKQTYQEFEVILVDDGSTDGSSQICEQYVGMDVRIQVIHQENQGPAVARNTGIEIAKGDYLMFVDADDYISEDCLLMMMKTAEEYRSDFVASQFVTVKNFHMPVVVKNNRKPQILTPEQAIETMLLADKFDVSPWAKLYRAELFREIRYPEGKIYEDLGTTYKILAKCQRPVYLPEILYYYRLRKNSIMDNHVFDSSVMQAIAFNKEIIGFVKERYPNIYPAAVYRFFCSNRRALHMAISTRGYKEEKRQMISNLASCRRIVYGKEKESIKNKAIVWVAGILHWILEKEQAEQL